MKRREMELIVEEQKRLMTALEREDEAALGAMLKTLKAWQDGAACADQVADMDAWLEGGRQPWRWRFAARSPVVRVALGAYDASTKARELVVVKEHGAYFFELTSEDEEALSAPVERRKMESVNALVKGRELVAVIAPWCRLALTGEHGFSAEIGQASATSHHIHISLKRVMGRTLSQWLLSLGTPEEAQARVEALLLRASEKRSEWAEDMFVCGATASEVANMVSRLRGAQT